MTSIGSVCVGADVKLPSECKGQTTVPICQDPGAVAVMITRWSVCGLMLAIIIASVYYLAKNWPRKRSLKSAASVETVCNNV